jgi:hypothetical protein
VVLIWLAGFMISAVKKIGKNSVRQTPANEEETQRGKVKQTSRKMA